MLDMFSLNHLFYTGLVPLVIVGLYYAFKNKSNRFKYWFLFSLTVLAWVIHFSRYYNFIDKKTEYIQMTKYFNSLGVLENIIDRISLYESKEEKSKIMKEIKLPPFGISMIELPDYTIDFMKKLEKHLPRKICNKILAGNNHRIPDSTFMKEKEYYQNSTSLESYLKERHLRKVEELEYHLKNNLVWFEQIITKEAISFVKNNQEILSGVIKNNKLYVTKIPYDLENYLNTNDDILKRYYACHCSFVRENILKDNNEISKEWCYCSAGFAKFPFEIVLGQELEVKLLSTPLNGDYKCRFEIDLEGINIKNTSLNR